MDSDNKVKILYTVIALSLILIFFIAISDEYIVLYYGISTTFVIVFLFAGKFDFVKSDRWIDSFKQFNVLIIGIILTNALIYLSGEFSSQYFPGIFLVILIYSGFITNHKHFILVNAIGLSTVVYSLLVYEQNISESIIFRLIYFILIYTAVVFVIRSYNLNCFQCTLEKSSCPNQTACALYNLKWNNYDKVIKNGLIIKLLIRRNTKVNILLIGIYGLFILVAMIQFEEHRLALFIDLLVSISILLIYDFILSKSAFIRVPLFNFLFVMLVIVSVIMVNIIGSEMTFLIYVIPNLYAIINFPLRNSLSIAIFTIVVTLMDLYTDGMVAEEITTYCIMIYIIIVNFIISLLTKEYFNYKKSIVREHIELKMKTVDNSDKENELLI